MLGAKLLIGLLALLVEPTSLTLDEVVARNLKAIGGAEAVSYRMEGTILIQGVPPTQITIEWKSPNKLRQELITKGFHVVQGYDGHELWARSGSTPRQVSPRERAQFVRSAEEGLPSLSGARDRGTKLELIGSSQIDRGSVIKIGMTRADGSKEVVSLDPETYLFLREESTFLVSGAEYESVTDLFDYRVVDDMRVPFLLRARPETGVAVTEIRVSSWTLNLQIPDARFSE
jgi:hypothetical protein